MTSKVHFANFAYTDSGGVSGYLTFSTKPFQTPSYDYDPRLKQPLLMDFTAFGSGRTRGTKAVSSGTIVVHNEDGALDGLATDGYAFDGLTAVVGYGDLSDDELTFTLDSYISIYNSLIETMEITEEEASFLIRDASYRYEKSMTPERYLGTNALPAGIEGTPTDVGGKARPCIYGGPVHVALPCVNTSKQLYEVDGQNGLRTGFSLTVRDQYVPLVSAGTYANQTDLENDALAPAAGEYKLWNDTTAGRSIVRLGAAPVGRVTATVTNPVSSVGVLPATTTECEVHAVLKQLAVDSGQTSLTVQVFTGGPDFLVIDDVYDVGVVCGIDDQKTFLDGMNEAAQSINAYWHDNGVLRMYQPFPSPSGGGSFTIAEGDIISISRIVPQDPERGRPAWKVVVKYAPNFAVLSESEIAGSVSQADRKFVTEQWREVYASDASIKTQWPNAPEIVVETHLINEADAQAEADRLFDLFGVYRNMYEVTLALSSVTNVNGYLGDCLLGSVTLTHSRFNLSAGVGAVIFGMKVNVEKDTLTLTVWR